MARPAWMLLVVVGLAVAVQADAPAETNELGETPFRYVVSDSRQLAQVLRDARPGTHIALAPGVYRGGITVRDVRGSAAAPIVIEPGDANDPPVFEGMKQGLVISRSAWITLRGLRFRKCLQNAIVIDDGGDESTPSMNLLLEGLRFEEVGSTDSHDTIRLAGVEQFVIRRCRFERWGGSAIDMIGSHNGLVDRCLFEGDKGERQRSAIEIKGGSSHILVQRSRFIRGGLRQISIGGQTGPGGFRPSSATAEARHVTVAGCRFIGGESHIAWVTSRKTLVHNNLFYRPGRWVARVLQESEDERFLRCGEAGFNRNVIVVDGSVDVLVNVGPNTDPGSFTFISNVITQLDGESHPVAGIAGFSPIRDVALDVEINGSMEAELRSDDPRMENIGPSAYRPPPIDDVRELSVPAVRLRQIDAMDSPLSLGIYVLTAVVLAILIAAVTYAYPLLRTRRRRRR